MKKLITVSMISVALLAISAIESHADVVIINGSSYKAMGTCTFYKNGQKIKASCNRPVLQKVMNKKLDKNS